MVLKFESNFKPTVTVQAMTFLPEGQDILVPREKRELYIINSKNDNEAYPCILNMAIT